MEERGTIHERQAWRAEPLTAATRGEGPACCLADTWVTPQPLPFHRLGRTAPCACILTLLRNLAWAPAMDAVRAGSVEAMGERHGHGRTLSQPSSSTVVQRLRKGKVNGESTRLPRARGLVPLGRGNEELALSLEGAEGEEGQEGTCRLWDLLSQGHQDPRREMA